MKAKVISIKRPENGNNTDSNVVVFQLAKSDGNTSLTSKLFSAVLNGENSFYYLPVDANGLLSLKDNKKVSDSELEQINVEFKTQLLDVNLFDFTVNELFPEFRAFKLIGAAANDDLDDITVFHRASFESREDAKKRLIAQCMRQANGTNATLKGVPVEEG